LKNITSETRNRLRLAAGLVADGMTFRDAARTLKMDPATFKRYRSRYPAAWQEELDRARNGERPAMDPTRPGKRTRDQIREIAAMFSAGAEHREIIDTLGISDNRIGHLRRTYPELWKSELDAAMLQAVATLRRLAGTDAIDNPAGYMQQGLAAERWAARRGIDIFPPGEDPTLVSFYRSYYKPMRLSDVRPRTIERYEDAVRRWALVTGDPALEEITAETLLKFRQFLEKFNLSPVTVTSYLKHVQAVLDKAGPPGPRNRDAAGILDKLPPAIRLPKIPATFPRIVPDEHLVLVYRAAGCMTTPVVPPVAAPAWWRALLAVARSTGLRRSTLFSMRMAMIDWEARELRLPAEILKGNRPQTVHLCPIAIEHLGGIRNGRELVFPLDCCMSEWHRRFHKLQDAAGLDRKDHFGLQTIRKTVGTLLWRSSPAAAQLALGHASSKTTQGHYVEPGGIVAEALDKLPQPDFEE